jgi:hypothetical protein
VFTLRPLGGSLSRQQYTEVQNRKHNGSNKQRIRKDFFKQG